jgi:hypothetical protein
MKFYIIFDKSGDYIEFNSLNFDTYTVLEYYVSQLNSKNINNFSYRNPANFIDQRIELLHSTVISINKIISTITDISFPAYADKDAYLDQKVLNKYHADWVNSQSVDYDIDKHRSSFDQRVVEVANKLHDMFPDDIRVTNIGNVLEKLRQLEIYNDLNMYVHRLESVFSTLRYKVDSWIEIDNPFSKELVTNNVSNFKISFNHLGRTLYNKYQTFDSKLEYQDENTFNQLLGFVDISLERPQTYSYSPEYLQWCQEQNQIPSGTQLNIGNIDDLEEHLTDCRLIISRNIRNNNSFGISLNKG